MHYYQHHIGDYRKDTTHLSFLEHGIYRHLLDSYYLNEIPLSGDLDKLMRSHSIRNADEKQALCNVLADFFLLTKKGYVHARCDVEIEAFHSKSEKARDAANARWANRNKDVDANAMQTHSESNAIGMPTNNQEPITNNHIKTITPDGFDIFWNAYPKKKSKGDAEKVWKKIKPNSELQTRIFLSIDRLKISEDWKKQNGQFIPYPATWLNAKGWEDQVSSAPVANDFYAKLSAREAQQ